MPARNSPAANGGSTRDNNSEIFTLDGILQCLSHPWRRQILYLLQEDPILTEGELVDRLAELEHDHSPAEIPASEHERILVQLRQHHLPKLQDTHVLEYDQRSETVRYTDPPKLLEVILQLTARIEAE